MAAGTSRDTKQTSVNNINKSSNKTKPKDPYANFSTAQSMGFGELEQQSQKKDEELSKQGNVGGWEVVTPATPATPTTTTTTTTMTTNENNNKNTKNDTKDETKEMKIGVKRTAPVGLGKIDLKTNENDDNNQDNKDKQEEDSNKLFKKRKIFNKR